MNQLSWGILGTGRINRKVIPWMQQIPTHRLLAVASRDVTRAASYAQEWNIPKSYGSYEELLAATDIDAVYISLPNALHAEWVVKATRQGKHVLCEKPLALSVSDIELIISESKKNGVVVTEGLMYRYHPKTQKIKELVQSGALGESLVMKGSFSFNIGQGNDPRLNPGLGGGCLWDIGCYIVDFAQYLLEEEPSQVLGCATFNELGVDETFLGMMKFKNNRLAQFDCTFRGVRNNYFEIVGDRRNLSITQPFKPDLDARMTLRSEDGDELMLVEGSNSFQLELEAFYNAIFDPGSVIPLTDSLRNVRTLNALYQSVK